MNEDPPADNEELSDEEIARAERRERVRKARLRRPKRGLEPIDPADQAMFSGYCGSKAGTLHKIGVEKYRTQDFFDMPAEDFDEEQLAGVRSGADQITSGRGMAMDTPLQGISVTGCYALIHTLHFNVVGRKTHYPGDNFLDEMRCKHRVTGSEGSLFNLVVYPDED